MLNPALTPLESALSRKVGRRVLLLAGALFFVANIDRIALSFAAVHGLNENLGLTATMFGFASGVFFIGYVLLEVPSNALLVRFGPRRWLARIMLTWGSVQVAMAFVTSPESLYLARFLLGVAEAGFVPGIMYLLTTWFPTYRLARATAVLGALGLSANVFGPMIGHGLVAFNSSIGSNLAGWQMIFVGTGVFALLGAVATWLWLTERPADARWLTPQERATWEAVVARSAPPYGGAHGLDQFRAALKNKWSWLVGGIYFTLLYGSYALVFFVPTIVVGLIEQYSLQINEYGVAAVIGFPFAVAIVVMLTVAPLADRSQRHGTIIAAGFTVAVVGIGITVTAAEPIISLIGLCVLASGTTVGIPILYSMVPKYAAGPARAAALAVVSAVGTAGGFFGPYVMGFLIDLTGTSSAGLYIMAGLLLLGGAVAFLVDRSLNSANQTLGSAASTSPASEKQADVV